MMDLIERIIRLAGTNDDRELVAAITEAQRGLHESPLLQQAAQELFDAMKGRPQIFSRVAFVATLVGVGRLWLATMRLVEKDAGSHSAATLLAKHSRRFVAIARMTIWSE